jgi:hypothetical protein
MGVQLSGDTTPMTTLRADLSDRKQAIAAELNQCFVSPLSSSDDAFIGSGFHSPSLSWR